VVGKIMATAPTPADLQGFRAVVVTAMEISTTLALTVTGGVRQRTMPGALGTAACSAIMAVYSVTATISFMGFLCVA